MDILDEDVRTTETQQTFSNTARGINSNHHLMNNGVQQHTDEVVTQCAYCSKRAVEKCNDLVKCCNKNVCLDHCVASIQINEDYSAPNNLQKNQNQQNSFNDMGAIDPDDIRIEDVQLSFSHEMKYFQCKECAVEIAPEKPSPQFKSKTSLYALIIALILSFMVITLSIYFMVQSR